MSENIGTIIDGNNNNNNDNSNDANNNNNIESKSGDSMNRYNELLSKIASKNNQLPHIPNHTINNTINNSNNNNAITDGNYNNSANNSSIHNTNFNYSSLHHLSNNNNDLVRELRICKSELSHSDVIINNLQTELTNIIQDNQLLINKNNELNQFLHEIQSNNDSLNNIINDLKLQLEYYKNNENSFRHQLDNNNKKLIESEKLLTLQISELQGKYNNINKEHDSIVIINKKYEYDNNLLKSEIDKLKLMLNDYDLKLQALSMEYNNNFNNLNNDKSNLSQQLQLLHDDYSELVYEFKLLKSELEAANNEINTLNNNKTNLQAQNEKLNNECLQLKSTNILLNTEIQLVPQLKQQVTILNDSNNKLKEFELKYSHQFNENNKLNEIINNLNNQINKLTDNNIELSNINNVNKQKLNDINSYNDNHSKTINDLQLQIDNLNATINKLNNDCQQYSNKLKAINTNNNYHSNVIGEYINKVINEIEVACSNNSINKNDNLESIQTRLMQQLEVPLNEYKSDGNNHNNFPLQSVFNNFRSSLLLLLNEYLSLKRNKYELFDNIQTLQTNQKNSNQKLKQLEKQLSTEQNNYNKLKSSNAQLLNNIKLYKQHIQKLKNEKIERDIVIEKIANDLKNLLNLALVDTSHSQNKSDNNNHNMDDLSSNITNSKMADNNNDLNIDAVDDMNDLIDDSSSSKKFSSLQSVLQIACNNLQNRISLIITDFIESQHRLKLLEDEFNVNNNNYSKQLNDLQNEVNELNQQLQNKNEILNSSNENYEQQLRSLNTSHTNKINELNSNYNELLTKYNAMQSDYNQQVEFNNKSTNDYGNKFNELYRCLLLLYRGYKPLYNKISDLQYQKLYWFKQAQILYKLKYQVNETAIGLTAVMPNNNSANNNASVKRHRISIRSVVLAILAFNRFIKQGYNPLYYGKLINIRGNTYSILKSDATSIHHNNNNVAINLPSIDDGTYTKAGISFVKLIHTLENHFHNNNANMNDTEILLSASNSQHLSSSTLIQNLGLGYYRFQTRLHNLGISSYSNNNIIDSTSDINIIRSICYNLASDNKDLQTQLDNISNKYNALNNEYNTAKQTLNKQEQTQQRAILTIQQLESNIKQHQLNESKSIDINVHNNVVKNRDELSKLVTQLKSELIKKQQDSREKLVNIQTKYDQEIKQLNEIINSMQREGQINKEEISTLTNFLKKKSAELLTAEKERKSYNTNINEIKENLDSCIAKNKILLERAKNAENQLNILNNNYTKLKTNESLLNNKLNESEENKVKLIAELKSREAELIKCQELIKSLTNAHRQTTTKYSALLNNNNNSNNTFSNTPINNNNNPIINTNTNTIPTNNNNNNNMVSMNGANSSILNTPYTQSRLFDLNPLAQSFLIKANQNAISANNNNNSSVPPNSTVKIRHHVGGGLSVDITDKNSVLQSAKIIQPQINTSNNNNTNATIVQDIIKSNTTNNHL